MCSVDLQVRVGVTLITLYKRIAILIRTLLYNCDITSVVCSKILVQGVGVSDSHVYLLEIHAHID